MGDPLFLRTRGMAIPVSDRMPPDGVNCPGDCAAHGVPAEEIMVGRIEHAERMQALGQLASGIAHDFNNILQVMQSGAGLIERHSADLMELRRIARTLQSAAERGSSITRRLLAFTRVGDLDAGPVCVASLFETVSDVLVHALGGSIRVRMIATPGVPTLIADRAQLETVLINLATNARDAMPSGGTLIVLAREDEIAPGKAHFAGVLPGTYVRIDVTDTGTGMDKATLARVCEPFFTTKPKDKGTGLGLAMAKAFAESHGGGLAVESALHCGTTVTLWLPAAGTTAGRTSEGVPKKLSTRHALVVDDDELVLETLAATLEDTGFAVLTARGAEEALALLKADRDVNLLLSDLSMPGMSGAALIREAQARHPGLSGILLTGYPANAQDDPFGGARAGRFMALHKPVGRAELLSAIEQVLPAHAAPGM